MRLHLHLLSDSTGETLENIAKAALAQYDDVETIRHFWPMVRSRQHLDRIVEELAAIPAWCSTRSSTKTPAGVSRSGAAASACRMSHRSTR